LKSKTWVHSWDPYLYFDPMQLFYNFPLFAVTSPY